MPLPKVLDSDRPAPRVSFVIPLYFTGRGVDGLLEAFRELEVAGGFNLVLVNDGSTDGTWDTVEAALATLPFEVVLVDLARNYGEHHAVLEGLRHANGQYAITLDDDLQNPPGEALRLLEHAEVFDDGKILEDPLVGIGGGDTTDDEPEHEGPDDTPRRPPPRPAPWSPRRLPVGGRPPSRGNRGHLDRRRGEAHRGGGGSQAIKEDADVVERIAAGRGSQTGVSGPWGRPAHDAPPPASPAAGDRTPSR